MKLLLIEDDPQFVQLVGRVAESLEMEFLACGTAEAGLERLAEGGIDLVIVDGVLPDKSGWRLIEELKARPGPHPRLVFLSAFFRDLRSFRKLKALGVEKVLHKPISTHELRSEIAALLQVPQERRSRRRGTEPRANDFEAELLRMRDAYAEKLVITSAVEFASLIDQAVQGDPDAGPALMDFLHRLAGTAGSYGQEQISEAAARLEERMNEQSVERALPEMKELLRMLRSARLDEETRGYATSLQARYSSILVVTEFDTLFGRIAEKLGASGLTTRYAPGMQQALDAILGHWPDVMVVDAAAPDPVSGRPVVEVLAGLETGIPMIVVGELLEGDIVTMDGFSMAADPGGVLYTLSNQDLQPFAGHSLLVCDDDPAICELVEVLFSPLGIRVGTVGDLAGYMSALVGERPSVVLMDVSFPMVSGFEMCRMSKSDPATRDIPVIFLSARTGLSDRRTAYQVGASGYVLKPIAGEQLMNEVTRILRQERAARLAGRLLADRYVGPGAGS